MLIHRKYSPARTNTRFVYSSDRACPCHATHAPIMFPTNDDDTAGHGVLQLSCHPHPIMFPTSLPQCPKLHYSSPASIRNIVVTGLAPVMFPASVMFLLAPVMFLTSVMPLLGLAVGFMNASTRLSCSLHLPCLSLGNVVLLILPPPCPCHIPLHLSCLPPPRHALRVGHLWCAYDRDLILVIPRSGP